MAYARWIPVLSFITLLSSCANPAEETGASVERVVSGDWATRFADDPSAHLVSLPPGRSYFDAWVYQFGASPSDWVTRNMECGPACVSMLERLSGHDGTNCGYRASIPGCPAEVHSECRQTGACGRATGFVPNSGRGTSVYQMRDVLDGLGFTTRAISGSGSDRMSFSSLQRAIDADHPMVVTVDACQYRDELSLGACSRSHFMVAYGYSDRYVYILDPGYRNGQRARITIDAFNRAIASDPSGVEVTRPGFTRFPNATWYPPGTVLDADGEYYYVVSPDPSGVPRVWHASPVALDANRLSTERAIAVTRDAIGCFMALGELDPTPHFREYRVDIGEIYLVDLATRERYVFLNYAAYLSFNGREEWLDATPTQIAEWSAYPLRGTLGFAPGTLVASDEPGVSTVWVVSYNDHGRLRLPIFNEETARVYGYDVTAIGANPLRSARVPAHDLDLLAGPQGEMLRIELARDCRGVHCLTADACFHPSSPGAADEASGSEQEPPESESSPTPPPPAPPPPVRPDRDGDGVPDDEDCAPDDSSSHSGASELCDGRDNNCDGIPDNGIPDRSESGACGTIVRSCRGGYWVPISGREPEPEVCNGADDDCDGLIDEDVCAPPSAPDAGVATDPNMLRIRLTSALQRECVPGWEIAVWGFGTSRVSSPGGEINASVAGWDGWSAITLRCPSVPERWRDWSFGLERPVRAEDFNELSLGGMDLRSGVLVCIEPWNTAAGARPVIPWDSARRGSCPP